MNQEIPPLAPLTPPMPEANSHVAFEDAANRLGLMRRAIGQAVVGQSEIIDQVLITLIAGGHVLLEGVPGLGKTLLVRALSKVVGCKTTRIQFTPDLMPSDVIGHIMYEMNTGTFKVRKGPIFTNLLLADEINRAPAKTQSALLEGMQERQVTLEGRSMDLPSPFMTLATQNPLEQEGTYPLPEAELDRFLLKVRIDYPSDQEELDLVAKVLNKRLGDGFDLSKVDQILDAATLEQIQTMVSNMDMDPRVMEYAVKIVRTTRSWQGISIGAGPRGSISLLRAARAYAMLQGRGFVIPDDIKYVALPALRHRIQLSPDMEIEGYTSDQILKSLLEKVEAPRL